jgi:hypothetical protein
MTQEGTAAFRYMHYVGFIFPREERLSFKDHDYTYFGVQSHGLHSRYTRLHTLHY